jgi:ABC-type multidrug transport system fused ATPase/permease subunit
MSTQQFSLSVLLIYDRLMYLTFAKIEIRVRAQLSAMIFDKSLRLDDAKGAVDDFDRQEVSPQDRMSEHSSTATNEDAEDAIPLMRVEDKAMNQPRSEGRAKSRPEQSRSSQQVPNLIAVDTIRVAEISSRQHIFIGSLLTFSIALLFLVRLIGWISFTSGLLELLLMVPMNMRASKAYGSAQHDIMGARDGKLKTLNEALRGIKQIKFTATENQWQSRVMELRRKELEKQRTSFIWAIILRLLFHSAPILLAVVSLSVYAGLNGSLSASVAFTSLGVFANIEFSFSVLPMAVMQLFDGLVSAKRIHSFLQQPEKKRSTTPGAHVSFQNATLMWPGADDYTMDPSQFRLTGIFAEFPQHELRLVLCYSSCAKLLTEI